MLLPKLCIDIYDHGVCQIFLRIIVFEINCNVVQILYSAYCLGMWYVCSVACKKTDHTYVNGL